MENFLSGISVAAMFGNLGAREMSARLMGVFVL